MTEEQLQNVVNKVDQLLKKELQIPDKYHHWVFGAAKIAKQEKIIQQAKDAVKCLEDTWCMNATATGFYDGPKFVITEDDEHISICAEDSSLITLIDGCMAFARELKRREMLGSAER